MSEQPGGAWATEIGQSAGYARRAQNLARQSGDDAAIQADGDAAIAAAIRAVAFALVDLTVTLDGIRAAGSDDR